MRRAQTSLEFMILVGFILFFFILFLFSLGASSSDKLYERQTLALEDVAHTVQREVAFASTTPDGYERTLSLPLQIVNLDYTLEVIEGSLYVHTVNERHALAVPLMNVTGVFTPGTNMIRRVNGTVFVNS